MSDVPTDVPGAAIPRIRGEDYVVLRVSRMFPGAPPTIAGLARQFARRSDTVFHVLLGYRTNAPAVIGLYRDQLGTPVPALDVARRRLRVEGTTPTLNYEFPNGTMTPYIAWPGSPSPYSGSAVALAPSVPLHCSSRTISA